MLVFALFSVGQLFAQSPAVVTLVKAGRLLDPRTGNVLSPAAVLIENGKIKEAVLRGCRGPLQREESLRVHDQHGLAVAHNRGAYVLRHLGKHAVQRLDDDFDLAEEVVDDEAVGPRSGLNNRHRQLCPPLHHLFE